MRRPLLNFALVSMSASCLPWLQSCASTPELAGRCVQADEAQAHADLEGGASLGAQSGASVRTVQIHAGPKGSAAYKPHVTQISAVVASPDASAALTRDEGGETRYWASLDGTRGPVAVIVAQPRQMAIDRHSLGGHRLAFVDAAGAGHALRANEKGEMQRLVMLPPTRPLLALVPLPRRAGARAEHADSYLALTQDRFVLWVSESGEVLDEWSAPRFPVHELRVNAHRVFAIAQVVEEGKAVKQIRELGFARPNAVEREPAASSDNADAPSKRAQPGKPAEPGKLAQLGETTRIDSAAALFEIDATHGRVWLLENAPNQSVAALRREPLLAGGLVGTTQARDRESRAYTLKWNLQAQVRMGLDPNGWPVVSHAHTGTQRFDPKRERLHGLAMGANDLPSAVWVGGVRLAGMGTYLAVESVDEEDRFMGFRGTGGYTAALSPTGEELLWSRQGELRVESIASGEVRVVQRSNLRTPSAVHWAADGSLVIANWDGSMELVDPQTGAQLDRLDGGGTFSRWSFDEGGKNFAWQSGVWGARFLASVDAGKFGPTSVVADSAPNFGPWSDDSGVGMWSFDGNQVRVNTREKLDQGVALVATTTDLRDMSAEERMNAALKDAKGAHLFLPLAKGRSAWARFDAESGRSMLRVLDAEQKQDFELELGTGGVVAMELGPDQEFVFVLADRPSERVLYAVELGDARVRWNRALPRDTTLSFAREADRMMLYSPTSGALLLGRSDGEVQQGRCSFEFEVLDLPPFTVNRALQGACFGLASNQ